IAPNTAVPFRSSAPSWILNSAGTWNTPANWDLNSVPNGTGITALVTNAITAAQTITLNTSVTLGELQMGSAANYAFTLSGANSLTFNNGGAGAVFKNQKTGSTTINVPIVLADALKITNSSDITIGAAISQSGTRSLLKAGSARLTLSAASSYSGGTSLNQGDLWYAKGGALGTGDVTVTSGGQLTFRPGGTSLAPDITIAGTGTGSSGALFASAVSTVLSGKLTLSGNATIGSDNSTGDAFTFNDTVNLDDNILTLKPGVATRSIPFTFNGAIIGTGGLTVNAAALTTGAVTVNLVNSNSFSGNTRLVVNSGATTGVATLALKNVNALKNSTLDTDVADTQKQVTFAVAGNNTYNLGGLKGSDDLAIDANTISVGANNADTTFAGSISGMGGRLTKVGNGTLTLSGTNSFTGDTLINAGALALGAAGSIANTSNINVSSGAVLNVAAVSGGFTLGAVQTLRGNGAVNGAMFVNGTLAPGMSIGRLTLSNAPVLAGTLQMEINKATGPVLSADSLNVTSGTLTFGGALIVSQVAGSLALTGGEVFDLFDAADGFDANSAFSSMTLPGLSAGLNWFTGNLAVDGTLRVNRAPSASNLAVSLPQGGSITVPIVGAPEGPTDADGDSLAISGVTQGAAGTVAFSATNVTYTSTSSASSDNFTYTVNDGAGGSATATINITLTSATTVSNSLSAGWSGTEMVFASQGVPGASYALERAFNLTPPVDWIPQWTNTAAEDGSLNFTNAPVPNTNNFWRTRMLP
ncbi:MAG: beta strand repeat-containing protein, partial [Verrucomicrobiota bacterium]